MRENSWLALISGKTSQRNERLDRKEGGEGRTFGEESKIIMLVSNGKREAV